MISIFLLELNQYDKAWEYITRVCRHRIFDIWQSYWPIYNILINTKKFDREPDYFGKICFFPDTLENVHDSFGETAALAVRNAVLCSKDDQEEFELLREHYDDIVSKSNNKELMIKRESEK